MAEHLDPAQRGAGLSQKLDKLQHIIKSTALKENPRAQNILNTRLSDLQNLDDAGLQRWIDDAGGMLKDFTKSQGAADEPGDWTEEVMDKVRQQMGDAPGPVDVGGEPALPDPGTGSINVRPSAIDPEEIQQQIAAEAGGAPVSTTSTTMSTGPPGVTPAVFGDPTSTYERPGPTEDQLVLRAAEKQRLKGRATRADEIRYARDPMNQPHFWYTRTDDPKTDAAMGAAMAQQFGGVMQEQARGRTAREQMLAQQVQFDKALQHKSNAELIEMLKIPNLPFAMQQAILRKMGGEHDLPGYGGGAGGAGGGGARMPGVEGRRQLEAEDPVLLGQLDEMRDEYGTDIGRSGGSPAEWLEHAGGLFGVGDVQTSNADQLSYTMAKLASMMKAGSINDRNIAAVSAWLSSEYDPAVLAWLNQSAEDAAGSDGRVSGSSITWDETVAFFRDVLAGRIPENPGKYAKLNRSWWQG